MSDHPGETNLLRKGLGCEESSRRQHLEERISQLQRDERSVHRAVWLMALLVALSATGLGYGAALGDNFPDNTPSLVAYTLCALGAGSLISLLVFVVLGIAYRRKLNQRRAELRQLDPRLLASRLRQPLVESSSGLTANSKTLPPRGESVGASIDPTGVNTP